MARHTDIIPTGKSRELPAFTACCATGGEPVKQHEIRICGEVELLPLRVDRSGKRLHRVWRKDQERTGVQRRSRFVTARERGGIAINLCGGLSAEKTTRTRVQPDRE